MISFKERLCTIETEIEVNLIPQKSFFGFAFALILIGQMIFRIHVHIDTSPRISHRFRFRNSEGA